MTTFWGDSFPYNSTEIILYLKSESLFSYLFLFVLFYHSLLHLSLPSGQMGCCTHTHKGL